VNKTRISPFSSSINYSCPEKKSHEITTDAALPDISVRQANLAEKIDFEVK
jgi:hypothetical protein